MGKDIARVDIQERKILFARVKYLGKVEIVSAGCMFGHEVHSRR